MMRDVSFKPGARVRLVATSEIARVVRHPNPPIGVVFIRCEETDNVCRFHGFGTITPASPIGPGRLQRLPWMPSDGVYGWSPSPFGECPHAPDELEFML